MTAFPALPISQSSSPMRVRAEVPLQVIPLSGTPLVVIDAAPSTADLLDGSTTTNNTTIITVPANRIWRGSVGLSGALTVAIGAGAATATPAVTVNGAGSPHPADTSVVARLALAAPAVGALALLGLGVASAITMPDVTIYAGSADATLKLVYNSATLASGVAVGQLIG